MRKGVVAAVIGISALFLCILLFGFINRGKTLVDSEELNSGLSGDTGTSVKLEVVTTFAADDSNAWNYKMAYKEWEMQTHNKVIDKSVPSDSSFKARVLTDFETDSEPDVLFFFYGADAHPFIQAQKVVSIEEIRTLYPDYASNMQEDLIPVSVIDNKAYAVPVNGFWEALYVNMDILEQAGVNKPGRDYTWEQFLADCEAIKNAGYIPIAAALGNIPHYWWELTTFNHSTPESHLVIPQSPEDEAGQSWVQGLADLRELYQLGYFPGNTLMAMDDETFSLFVEGKAAFLLDGSWKLGSIVTACQSDPEDVLTLDEEKLAKFDIVFSPTLGNRNAGDLIGGLSMGYYITRKAWENEEKREAAVSFVSHMTSDKNAVKFARYTKSALKNPGEFTPEDMNLNSLEEKAGQIMEDAVSLTGAVQDLFYEESRTIIFNAIPGILNGTREPEQVVEEGLNSYYQMYK